MERAEEELRPEASSVYDQIRRKPRGSPRFSAISLFIADAAKKHESRIKQPLYCLSHCQENAHPLLRSSACGVASGQRWMQTCCVGQRADLPTALLNAVPNGEASPVDSPSGTTRFRWSIPSPITNQHKASNPSPIFWGKRPRQKSCATASSPMKSSTRGTTKNPSKIKRSCGLLTDGDANGGPAIVVTPLLLRPIPAIIRQRSSPGPR